MKAPMWQQTVFTVNPDRLLSEEAALESFRQEL
jgi:hypothetical protein